VLTFVAEDDIWLAAASGGRAWRVSADRAQVSHPRLAPGGSLVAWTSWRDGPPEVYVAGVDGDASRRLSYWSDPDTRVCGWTPDGEILALTCSGQAFDRFAWAHIVPADAGPPRRLDVGPVSDVALGSDARVLLNGSWGRDPAFWKRYRGGTSGRLWTAGAAGPFRRILAGVRGQFASPMLVRGRLAFLSDHEGTGNLYSCQLDGSGLLRHTDHDGYYARQASTDGSRVVYQCAGEIWVLDDLEAGSEARRVDITLGSAAAARAPRLVSAQDQLGHLSCDHTGRASAVEVRGTVHWLTHRDGPARALAVTPDARARLPCVLGRAGGGGRASQVIWVSDAGGSDALEIAPGGGPDLIAAAPPPRPRRLAEGALGLVSELAAAPDGSTVAVAARDGRLHVVDVATGQVTLLAQSDDGPVTGIVYAPDSAWLAWSHPGPRPLARIRLARLADAAIVEVTDGRFVDSAPAFTSDGCYLAFLSVRSFDPVYDAHFFDLSFPFGSRPYLVPLAAGTPSPFAPVAEGRPAADRPDAGPRDASGKDSAGAHDGQEQEEPPPAVTVDPDGLAGRVVGVPVAASLYSSLRAVAGGLAWLKEPLTGVLGESAADLDGLRPRPALERFDLAKRTCTELVSALNWFEVSGDGLRLVVRDKDTLRVVPSDRAQDAEGSADTVTVDLSRARFTADPVAEWRHAYDEAGRYMSHDFWVADMADVDWAGVLDTYRPVLSRLGGPGDFADLLWETFGELGASHAYVRSAKSPGEDGSGWAGLLGADLAAGPDGTWRVARVLPGESSDPRARSPLAAPGVNVQPGDALLAVDGRPVDPAAGPGPLLVGSAGRPVELTVAPSDGGPPRRLAVTPLASERRLRYQDWVAGRRHLVRELSGGRAGYLHIPDMMGEGWAHFHRDLRVEMAHDALIMDVRANRGGHVSELVVEKLARRIMGWDVPRGLQPQTYPQDAPRGAVVALADEFAGSDGDMVTAAIRILGLGPVVGTRTWGGVLGIGDPFTLVEGTQITVPRYAIWLDGYGWEVENHGVDPDVEVVITPDDWASGTDPQLETAVRLAMEALEARPPARPPDTSTRASRRRPPLPPRPRQ
jgi:tricorn protease